MTTKKEPVLLICDTLLDTASRTTNGDPDLALAALGFALLSLAKANGTSHDAIDDLLRIVQDTIDGQES
jgi:hypothetical protein